ncbi:MAG: ATPase [Thermosipho sp. (in: Bacteria)]|nr:ATPase [Thermosipho sp. (in: thermotogales)]
MRKNEFLKKFLYVIGCVYILVVTVSLVVSPSLTFIVCYSLGTVGSILYTYSLYLDIIGMYYKKKKGKKGFYIRYLFSASLFLLAGILFVENRTLAIIGVFFGLINVKIAAYIAGFLFGGDRHE